MKKINASLITDTAGMPIKGPTLDFLQQSYQEAIDGLARSIVVDPTSITILSGCAISPLGAGLYSISSGYVYYANEIFVVDPVASVNITGATQAIGNIATTNPAPDPVNMSDKVSRSLHDVRKIVITNGATGTGGVGLDFSAWKITQIQANINALNTTNAAINAINGAWTVATPTIVEENPAAPLSVAGGVALGTPGGTINYKVSGKTLFMNVYAYGTTSGNPVKLLIQLPTGTCKTSINQYASCGGTDSTASTSFLTQIIANGGVNCLAVQSMTGSSFTAAHRYFFYFSIVIEIN